MTSQSAGLTSGCRNLVPRVPFLHTENEVEDGRETLDVW